MCLYITILLDIFFYEVFFLFLWKEVMGTVVSEIVRDGVDVSTFPTRELQQTV